MRSFPASIIMLLVLCFHNWCLQRSCVLADFLAPFNQIVFEYLGHVNIGLLVQMTQGDGYADDKNEDGDQDSETLCNGPTMKGPQACISQAAVYITDIINREQRLPHNLTLGFVMLDACSSDKATSTSSLTFVDEKDDCEVNSTAGDCVTDNARVEQNGMQVSQSYDVIGVISSVSSSQADNMFNTLGPAEVTTICISSTDANESKAGVPHLIQLVPPNANVMAAVFAVIREMGWTYVSMVYTDNAQGRASYAYMQIKFREQQTCLAAVRKVRTSINDTTASNIAAHLARNPKARVVILVVPESVAMKVIRASVKLVARNHFVFVGTDYLMSALEILTYQGVDLLGSLIVHSHYQYVEEFDNWFSARKLPQPDPWFARLFQSVFNCSLNDSSCDRTLSIGVNSDAPENVGFKYAGVFFDAVDMMVSATTQLLAHCPHAPDVDACVSHADLYKKLLETKMEGYSGSVKLDDKGNRIGDLVVSQVIYYEQLFPRDRGALQTAFYYDSVNDSLLPRSGFLWPSEPPTSVCSEPCPTRHATIYRYSQCCWDCSECRPDERLSDNNTHCLACQHYEWPDSDTGYKTCTHIVPDVQDLREMSGVLLMLLSLFFLLCCLSVFCFYLLHRKTKIIKASSIQLSFMMLFGLVAGFLSNFLILLPPNDHLCRVYFVVYSTSFVLLYGPLLVRTQRIYRIFNIDLHCGKKPSCISNWHQIMFASLIVSFQVSVTVIDILLQDKWVIKKHIFAHQRQVELTCHISDISLLSTFGIGVMLVVVCLVMAFKTRHLPNNFNESHFILKCAIASMTILLCFFPSYFVAVSYKFKMQLLALAIGLNHVVSLSLLFLPKLYKVAVDKRANFSSASISGAHVTSGSLRIQKIIKQRKKSPIKPSRGVTHTTSGHIVTAAVDTVTANDCMHVWKTPATAYTKNQTSSSGKDDGLHKRSDVKNLPIAGAPTVLVDDADYTEKARKDRLSSQLPLSTLSKEDPSTGKMSIFTKEADIVSIREPPVELRNAISKTNMFLRVASSLATPSSHRSVQNLGLRVSLADNTPSPSMQSATSDRTQPVSPRPLNILHLLTHNVSKPSLAKDSKKTDLNGKLLGRELKCPKVELEDSQSATLQDTCSFMLESNDYGDTSTSVFSDTGTTRSDRFH